MAYHHRYGTTGLVFAWNCWQAGSNHATRAETLREAANKVLVQRARYGWSPEADAAIEALRAALNG